MEAVVDKHSRVGKRPVALPKGVQVTVAGTSVTVKGPKGELSRTFPPVIEIAQEGDVVTVSPAKGSGKRGTQFQGTARALIGNAVKGVSEGFKLSLDLYGTGYRAELKGQEITLSLGLSHQVVYNLPVGVSCKVETIDQAGTKRPRVHLESHDNELLGRTAARIKSFRPPEPYNGKGVRYTGERIREKAGKTGSK